MFLKFLNNLLKQWNPSALDNSVVTILRQIVMNNFYKLDFINNLVHY